MASLTGRVASYIHRNGIWYTGRRGLEKLKDRLLKPYDKLWRTLEPKADELEKQRKDTAVQEAGLISVAIPVYNTRPDLLNALADSLLNQSYANWEACLYDGASTSAETEAALDALEKRDQRFRIVHGKVNEGIAGNSNLAVAMAKGEWIALCDHDDLLTADALYCVAKAITEHQPEMIFSDEDKVNETGTYFYEPSYKPDFCPDDLRSGNYICHLTVVKKSLMDKIGGFRTGFDGSQDHELFLRCSEATDKIVHIPRVLYHWRTVGASMSHQHIEKCLDAEKRAIEEHMARLGMKGTVSIERGLMRLKYETRQEQSIELIVIDNGDPKTWPEFVDRMRGWHTHPVHRMVISPWKESAKDLDCDWIPWQAGGSVYPCINQAVARSTADVIVVLYAAVMMGRDDQWLDEMLMYAQRDDVGAVTPLLVNHGGHTMHAGFAVGMEPLACSCSVGKFANAGGWHNMLSNVHNVAAVSGACFMIRRDHFIPFDEEYVGGLGTVDWSLKLAQQGFVHVYTPQARGKTDDLQCADWLLLHKAPEGKDAERYRATWGDHVHDLSYSVNFARQKANYALPKCKKEG